jgi:hypothetical protein
MYLVYTSTMPTMAFSEFMKHLTLRVATCGEGFTGSRPTARLGSSAATSATVMIAHRRILRIAPSHTLTDRLRVRCRLRQVLYNESSGTLTLTPSADMHKSAKQQDRAESAPKVRQTYANGGNTTIYGAGQDGSTVECSEMKQSGKHLRQTPVEGGDAAIYSM